MCNIQICQVAFKKYDNDWRMFVLWCACVKISAVAHTNTHSHARENADVCKINRNTSPPPLLLLPLLKSHPRKINADSVFLFLLLSPQNVHLRASYLSRTEGSKKKSWLPRATSCSDASTTLSLTISHQWILSLHPLIKPYLSLIRCSFHLSRPPSCTFFLPFSSRLLLTEMALFWPETSCSAEQGYGESGGTQIWYCNCHAVLGWVLLGR